MAVRHILPEWRDNNERIRYPFIDTATLRNAKGVVIDPTLFVDAALYPVGGGVGTYLKKITVTASSISFTIADPTAGETGTGEYVFGSTNTNDDVINVIDQYDRTAGVFVSSRDKLELLAGIYQKGEHEFTQSATEFCSSVVTPLPGAGLRGFLLDDGNLVAGDVWLVGSSGVVLRWVDDQIQVNAIGDPYAKTKECTLGDVPYPLPSFCGVRTFNGISPDDQGDFKIVVGSNVAQDNVLRIEQSGSRLMVKLVGKRNMVDNG